MKIRLFPQRKRSGQVMAEACIGLSIMVFGWIVVTYSMFMANNHVRTAMAARYAAWHKGASSTAVSDEQLAQLVESSFFYQTGVCKVVTKEGEGPDDLG